jgi:YegS/Rv2252/BmrU family lipid kinase
MRLLAIVNPASANGATATRWRDIASQLMQAFGPSSVDTVWTEQPGHAIDLARRAAAQDIVLCVGGDGTLNEVVNGLMRHTPAQRPALALLQSGTGSDFARMLGLAPGFEPAISRLRSGATRTVDIGELAYMSGRALQTRHFINIAGLGFDAEVSRALGMGAKTRASYFLTVFRVLLRYRPRRMRITVMGDAGPSTREIHAFLAAVCNGQFFGGGMHVSPQSDPGDGHFELVTIGAMSTLEFVFNFLRVYRGAHLTHPKVAVEKIREVRIEPLDQPLALEAEGEALGAAPLSVRLLPGALRICSG